MILYKLSYYYYCCCCLSPMTLNDPFGTKVVHLGQRRIGEKRD